MEGNNKLDISSLNKKNKSLHTGGRTLNSQMAKMGTGRLGDYGAIGSPIVPKQTNYFNRRNGSDSRTSRRSNSRGSRTASTNQKIQEIM